MRRPQNLKVEDVKTKLSCQTSFKCLKVQVAKTKPALSVPLRDRSRNDLGSNEGVPQPSAGQACPSIFRGAFCPARHSISCTCYLSKTHFMRDFPQKQQAEDVKTKLACETSSKSESGRCENEAFVTDVPQKIEVEDVKTKLSFETSLKK